MNKLYPTPTQKLPHHNPHFLSLFQTALLSRYRAPDDDHGVFQMILLSVVCLIFLLVGIVFVIRTIGKIAFGMNRIQFRPNAASPAETFPPEFGVEL